MCTLALQKALRSLCSQMSTGEPGLSNTQGCSCKWEDAHITCYLPRRPGADMANSLVTFSLVMWPHWILPHPLSGACFSWSVYRTYLYGKCYMCFTKSFDVVPSNVYLVYLVDSRFKYTLFCTWDWVNYHKQNFHQIVLCLRMSKIKATLAIETCWTEPCSCLPQHGHSAGCEGHRDPPSHHTSIHQIHHVKSPFKTHLIETVLCSKIMKAGLY